MPAQRRKDAVELNASRKMVHLNIENKKCRQRPVNGSARVWRKKMKIKGFDKDLKCRGFQFEIGKEYKIDTHGKPLELCSDTVFHYCDSLQKVHEYYSCNDDTNRFCEIEVLGEEVSDGEKCGSNHIRILREITGEELDILKGLINGNTRLFNTGCWNSGNRNSGNWNSGSWNSGNWNSGNWNSGNWNSGNWNSGNWNSGSLNNGSLNSGDWNSGYRNSGDRNSGDWNTGMFNKCDHSTGFFCTVEPTVRLFNKDTNLTYTEFLNSEYYRAMCSGKFILTEWVEYTKEEIQANHDKEMIDGYLKDYSYEEACQLWWEHLSEKDKKIVRSMPNFDADIFEEITGIKLK